MNSPRNVLATCVVLTAALAGAHAAAAPMSIDSGVMVDMRGSIATTEHDVQRQGYVTAHRSASMASSLRGRARARGQAVLGLVSGLNPQLPAGWTIHTAVATADVFSPLIGGVVPAARSDLPAGASSRLSSSFKVGEVGRLDDGQRAVQRVIEGARVFSNADDPASMLFTTR